MTHIKKFVKNVLEYEVNSHIIVHHTLSIIRHPQWYLANSPLPLPPPRLIVSLLSLDIHILSYIPIPIPNTFLFPSLYLKTTTVRMLSWVWGSSNASPQDGPTATTCDGNNVASAGASSTPSSPLSRSTVPPTAAPVPVIDADPDFIVPELPQLSRVSGAHFAASGGLKRVQGRRNKIPLEKGYSQQDWLRISRSSEIGGKHMYRGTVSVSMLRQHATEDDAWIAVHGRVYNVTPYMRFHPGGVDVLMRGVGKDATKLFLKFHAWVNVDSMLRNCCIGPLLPATEVDALHQHGDASEIDES